MAYARYRKRPRRRSSYRKRSYRNRSYRVSRRRSKVRFVRPSRPRGSASSMRMRPTGISIGQGTGLSAARKRSFDWKKAADDASRFLNPIGVSVSEWKKLPSWAQAIAFQAYGKDVMKNALASANLKPENWVNFGNRAYEWAKSAYDDIRAGVDATYGIVPAN